MRHIVLAVALAGQVGTPNSGLEVLRSWLAAVEQHEPGAIDAPVQQLSAWTDREFDLLLPYFWAWQEFARDVSRGSLEQPRRRFSDAEIQTLRTLARPAANRGPNLVLKLAAQLHADVAIVRQPGPRYTPVPGDPRRPRQVPAGALRERRLVVRSPDGRMDGIEYGALHWDFARTLLDQLTPGPEADPWVARWYRAAAAAEAGRFAFADARPLLTHARKILPDDALIFFASGCLFESLASPPVQDFIASTVLPRGLQIDIASAPANLNAARAYFQRALLLDPSLTEARIRLARVTGRLGRADEATAALGEVLAAPPAAPALHFLAAMLMAEIEQARGRDDLALPLFERAAALFPHAQSAHVALAHLARKRGDTEAAYARLRQVIGRPADRPGDEDPWWDYYRGEGPRAPALLTEVQSALAAERIK